MMDFAIKIEEWWAIEAMIASYNYVYQVAYKTSYEQRGPIGVTRYGSTHIAPYQFEFLALSANPRSVIEAIRQYPQGTNDKHILNTFHAVPSMPEMKAKYQSLGYDFIRTGPILGRRLPSKRQVNDISTVFKAKTIHKAEFANESLTTEGERMPLDTLKDENIHNFYAEIAEHAVGWLQMVTVYPQVAYIQHMYTLAMYRGLKIASTMVERAQGEAARLGMKYIVMVPSEMALGLAIRLGYRPLAYFTAFRPAEDAE